MDNSRNRPVLSPNTPGTKQKQPPRSVLTTVNRKRKRITWKYRALTIAVYVLTILIAIVIGASQFYGLQKLETLNRRRLCSQRKTELLENRQRVCANNASTVEQCGNSTKEIGEQLAKCYGLPIEKPKPPNTMARALIYVFTTYSTIGYGNVAAKYVPGQVFTMIYAYMGIPIFLVFLNHFGRWAHYGLVCGYEKFRQKTGAGKNFFLTTVDSEDVGLFAFTVVVTVAYMSVAAAFYAVLLGWDYWQAFYFSFQSMALIGFGDQYPELEDPSFIMWHMAITTMGIILLAVCFFIVRDWWSKVVSAVTVAVALKFNMTVPQEVALNSENDTLREAGGLDLEEVNKSILSGSAQSLQAKGAFKRSPSKKRLGKMSSQKKKI